jgi:hypothetical protein
MKNSVKSDLTAEIFFIVCKGLQRLGDCLKEECVERFFISERKGVKLMRNGKNNMEVVDGQKIARAILDPLGAKQRLAFRAMAVPAGIIGNTLVVTMVAMINVPA